MHVVLPATNNDVSTTTATIPSVRKPPLSSSSSIEKKELTARFVGRIGMESSVVEAGCSPVEDASMVTTQAIHKNNVDVHRIPAAVLGRSNQPKDFNNVSSSNNNLCLVKKDLVRPRVVVQRVVEMREKLKYDVLADQAHSRKRRKLEEPLSTCNPSSSLSDDDNNNNNKSATRVGGLRCSRRRRNKSNKKRSKNLSFDETVKVMPIPMRTEYNHRVRSRIWSSAMEIHQNAARNAVEFAAEGWDWRQVMEDDKMYVCVTTGDLIHPCHYNEGEIKKDV